MHQGIYRLALLIMCFTSLPLLGEEAWKRSLEYFSPFDGSGFVVPHGRAAPDESPDPFEDEAATLEEADESQSPLLIWSLNSKGFMHQGRRRARALDGNPLALPERTRVYTGGSGFIAIGASDRFFALLEAPTSLHSAFGPKGWRWTLLEEQARIRLTSQGEAPRIRWKDANDPAWGELSFSPGASGDVILIRDGESLQIYQLHGRSLLFAPAQRLRPGRKPGFLRKLQDLQLSPRANRRTRIELHAEQVLQLDKKGQSFELTIGSADPEIWGPRLLASSPGLNEESAQNEKPPLTGIRALRSRILEEGTRDLQADAAGIDELIQRGRYEEALYLLRREKGKAGASDRGAKDGLEASLLFRLQQGEGAAQRALGVSDDDPMKIYLAEEQRLSLLRAGSLAASDLPLPELRFAATLLPEERYQIAIGWQKLGKLRTALDFWELRANGEEGPFLGSTRTEWHEQLLSEKRWYFDLACGAARESDIRQNGRSVDKDETALISNRVDARASIARVLDRSPHHRVSVDLALDHARYLAPETGSLARSEAALGLGIELPEIFGPESSLTITPEISRRTQGATIDALSYRIAAARDGLGGSLHLSLAQMQALDPAPSAAALLDIETGERSGPGDQGFKSVAWEGGWKQSGAEAWPLSFAMSWKDLNYRSPLRDDWDRQIIGLRLGVEHRWNLAWSSELETAGAIHAFRRSGDKRSRQFAYGVKLSTVIRTALRWEQVLSLSDEERPSAYFGRTQNKAEGMLGTRYRW